MIYCDPIWHESSRNSETFANCYELKFHDSSFPRSILVTSSRGCLQQVVRVVLVDIGERHDTRTNGQHYTAAHRRPTNQVSAWQAGRGSRPTRPTCCEDVRNTSCVTACRRGCHEYMLRRWYEETTRKRLSCNSGYTRLL